VPAVQARQNSSPVPAIQARPAIGPHAPVPQFQLAPSNQVPVMQSQMNLLAEQVQVLQAQTREMEHRLQTWSPCWIARISTII